jgi:hypothetical protein
VSDQRVTDSLDGVGQADGVDPIGDPVGAAHVLALHAGSGFKARNLSKPCAPDPRLTGAKIGRAAPAPSTDRTAPQRYPTTSFRF